MNGVIWKSLLKEIDKFGGRSLSSYCKDIKCYDSSASKVLGDLMGVGLVCCERKDGRSYGLFLTDKGHKVLFHLRELESLLS